MGRPIIKGGKPPEEDQLYYIYLVKEHGLKSHDHLREDKKKEDWMYDPMEEENVWREYFSNVKNEQQSKSIKPEIIIIDSSNNEEKSYRLACK